MFTQATLMHYAGYSDAGHFHMGHAQASQAQAGYDHEGTH